MLEITANLIIVLFGGLYGLGPDGWRTWRAILGAAVLSVLARVVVWLWTSDW